MPKGLLASLFLFFVRKGYSVQKRQKHVPLRTCVACRESRAKRDLVRVIRNDDERITIDLTGKQKGRGAYLCRQKSCWEKAILRKALQRALHIELCPEDITELQSFAESLPEMLEESA